MLTGLARLVSEAPWTLRADDRARAAAVGLGDGAVVQAIALAAMFNYLNRVADGVGIELDYEVAEAPPAADPATPPWPRADRGDWPRGAPALSTAAIPRFDEALAAWRAHALERDAPLSRADRAGIAFAVAALVGDASVAPAPLAAPLAGFVEVCTLAPWRLGAEALAPLRAAGLDDDVALFDVIATTAFCNLASRLRVALAALGAS